MADQDKGKWWSSVPGILTAATGFVAALSGLVAGLNQLGVFDRRETAAPREVAAAPAAPMRAEVEEHTAAGDSARADSPPVAVRAAPAPASRPAPRSPSGMAPAPARPAPVLADTVGADTTAERPAGVLRAGTVLELATTARVCAPDSGTRRFTARTSAPVRAGGATALPRGTGAVLRLGRGAAANTVVIRLDSLLPPEAALAVPKSATRVRRGSVTGTCLKPATRISVTLGAAVSVPGS